MNKKGVEIGVFFLIFEAILVVLFAAILFTYINTLNDGTSFEKRYLSKDVALMISTISAVPGNIEVEYIPAKGALDKFSFDFSNNLVSVSEPAAENLPIVTPYLTNERYLHHLPLMIQPQKMTLSKDGDTLGINQEFHDQFRCEKILQAEQKLAVMVSYDENAEIAPVAQKVVDKLRSKVHEKVTYYHKEQPQKDEIKLLVKLSAAQNVQQIEVVKAYYSQEWKISKQVACSFLNEIAKKHAIEGLQLLPHEGDDFSVQLQIGNTLKQEEGLLQHEEAAVFIATSIDEAIRKHYG